MNFADIESLSEAGFLIESISHTTFADIESHGMHCRKIPKRLQNIESARHLQRAMYVMHMYALQNTGLGSSSYTSVAEISYVVIVRTRSSASFLAELSVRSP